MSIAQEDFLAFDTSEIGFVRFLYSKVTCVVATLVIAVFLHLFGRDFTDITEDMRSNRILILTDGTRTDLKATVFEHSLLQLGIVLYRELCGKGLLRIAGITWILRAVLDLSHSVIEHLDGDTKRITEVQGIEFLHFAHGHHKVISRLIVNQQLTITVIDHATSRIDCSCQEGVVLRHDFVLLLYNLQEEKTDNVDKENQQNQSSYNETSFFKFIIMLHSTYFLRVANSSEIVAINERARLIATFNSVERI